MSQPEDVVPARAAEAPVDPQPVEAPQAQTQPMESALLPLAGGGPYRIPEQPEIVLLEIPPKVRRPWPVIGPSFSVYAVLLWSFVVFGQFTTSLTFGRPVGQGVALAIVFAATFAAWIVNVRASSNVAPSLRPGGIVLRAVGIGVLSVVFFFLSLVFAIVLGQSARGLDLFVAFVLIIVATLAAFIGPRLTSRTPPERTHGERVRLVMLWIGGVILTLVAGVDLAANG